MQTAQPAPQKAPRRPRPYDKWNPAFNPQLLTKFEGIYKTQADLDKERNADESLHSDIMQPAPQPAGKLGLPPPPPPPFQPPRFDILRKNYSTLENAVAEFGKRLDGQIQKQQYQLDDKNKRIAELEEQVNHLKWENDFIHKREEASWRVIHKLRRNYRSYRDRIHKFKQSIYYDYVVDNIPNSFDLVVNFSQGYWENDYEPIDLNDPDLVEIQQFLKFEE